MFVAGSVPFNVPADLYMKSVILVEDELMMRVNIMVETKDKNEKINECLMIPFTYPPLKVEVSFSNHEDLHECSTKRLNV